MGPWIPRDTTKQLELRCSKPRIVRHRPWPWRGSVSVVKRRQASSMVIDGGIEAEPDDETMGISWVYQIGILDWYIRWVNQMGKLDGYVLYNHNIYIYMYIIYKYIYTIIYSLSYHCIPYHYIYTYIPLYIVYHTIVYHTIIYTHTYHYIPYNIDYPTQCRCSSDVLDAAAETIEAIAPTRSWQCCKARGVLISMA